MIKIEAQTDFFERDRLIKESWEHNQKVIEEILEDVERRLGEGRTAIVIPLNINNKVCLKVYKKETETHKNPYHIRPENEENRLEELQGIGEDISVAVPKPYLVGEYGKLKFMMMEKVDGPNIREMIQNEEMIPEKFDLADFKSRVETFLERMHDKRIYHRDLHWENIMIDKKTGKIYVIDFGSSTSSFGGDESDIYMERTAADDVIYFEPDKKEFDKVYRALKNQILTNG